MSQCNAISVGSYQVNQAGTESRRGHFGYSDGKRALQAFPAGYLFAGSRWERVRRLGHAFPTRLAAKVNEGKLLRWEEILE